MNLTSLPSPYPLVAVVPTSVALLYGTSGTWPAANRALYMPFSLPSTQRITEIYVTCIVTGSGTFDLGLYDSTCSTLLASMGSTSLTVGRKTWTLTDPIQVLAGQRMYVGMSCSSATAQFLRQLPSVLHLRAAGVAQQATAHPLGAPTPVQVASAYLPAVALTFVT